MTKAMRNTKEGKNIASFNLFEAKEIAYNHFNEALELQHSKMVGKIDELVVSWFAPENEVNAETARNGIMEMVRSNKFNKEFRVSRVSMTISRI